MQEYENFSHPEKPPEKESWHSRAQKSLSSFLVVAAGILFYYLLQYLGNISGFFLKILGGISPVIWGLIFAYLLSPIANFYEENLTELILDPAHVRPKPTKNKFQNQQLQKLSGLLTPETDEAHIAKTQKRIHVGASVLMLLTAILFITVLLLLIVPEISNSITNIGKDLPSQADRLINDIKEQKYFDGDGTFANIANETIFNALKSVQDWFQNKLPEEISQIVNSLYTGVKSVFSVVYNLVIGLILSLYITIDNKKLKRQVKQMVYSLFPEHTANTLGRAFERGNRKLNGAIRGKIVDSMIIGLICFTLLTVINLFPMVNFPYPVLLAVIVGVTNVVPFFGPMVGGFITGVLVLLENPRMTIPYIIIIVLIQQFDSNYLDPHMVGGSIGLRPFWSIFACLLGSSILGVPGFVLGPPTVAFLYEVASEWTEERLREKGLAEEFYVHPEPAGTLPFHEPQEEHIPFARKVWYWWQLKFSRK